MKLLLWCILFYACPWSHDTAYAIDCGVHPVYCSIVKLNPHVPRAHAMRLSNLMHTYAKRFNMDPFDSVAIAMQENAFRDHSPAVTIITEQGQVVSGIGDIGVFQIRVDTAIDYGFDPRRLLYDLEYQVLAHFRILRTKTLVCRKKGLDRKALACYHSYTPVFRDRYWVKIRGYLEDIQNDRAT